MDVQSARNIRDKERGLARRHALALQSGTKKHREIRFDRQRPAQLEQARKLLAQLEGVEVAPGQFANSVSVWYEVSDHTLASLEKALTGHGFQLEDSFYCRLVRGFVRYFEDTQLRNLRQPERLIKKSNEIYSKAWEHHPHGDHDDTPVELRLDR